MPNPAVPANAGGMPNAAYIGGLLQDNIPRLLIDICRMLPADERAEFREVAGDFSYGLNSTIEGSARAMRRWVANPPSWISRNRQEARKRFLAKLDAAMSGELQQT